MPLTVISPPGRVTGMAVRCGEGADQQWMGAVDAGVHDTDGGRVAVGRLGTRRQLVDPVDLFGCRLQGDHLCQLVRAPQFGEIVEYVERAGQLLSRGFREDDHSIGETEGMAAETDAGVFSER